MKRRALLAFRIVWVVLPLALLCVAVAVEQPYVLALAAVLALLQGIETAADRVVAAIRQPWHEARRGVVRRYP